MPQITLTLSDEQYIRSRSAIAKHLGLMTEGVQAVKAAPALHQDDVMPVSAIVEVAEIAPEPRDATDEELEAFLINHLREMVNMVERQTMKLADF